MEPPAMQQQASLHGFQFHSRSQRIDWRKIAAVDVDQVARDVDVDTLQKNVVHLTFCDIDHELEGTAIDSNFVKLFKLAQLCIEYLMHSQDLLLQSLADAEEQLAEATQALEEERKFRLCDQEAIRQLQRENRKRRRIIENQQLEMLRSDRHAPTGAPCPYCRKVFVSLAYLQAHVVRRHPEKPAPTEDALLAQWQRVATGTALPAAAELHRGLQELRAMLVHGGGEQERQASREELLYRLDELQRKCDSLAAAADADRGGGCLAAGGGEVAWSADALHGSEGQAALASLSQQLLLQKEEVSRLLAQQEKLFLQRMDALAKDVVMLTKTSTTLERKLSQLEEPRGQQRLLLRTAEGGPGRLPYSDALRFPQSTLSVPVPAPRHRVFFHGKSLRHPPSLMLPRNDSRIHAKVAQSGPIKERNASIHCGRAQLTRQGANCEVRSERIKSAVHSTPNLIDALREEIMDITRDKLSNMALHTLAKASVTAFRDSSRNVLDSHKRLAAKKNKKFFDVRQGNASKVAAELTLDKVAPQGHDEGGWPFGRASGNTSRAAIASSTAANSETPKDSGPPSKFPSPNSSEAGRRSLPASSGRFDASPASADSFTQPRRFLVRSGRSRQSSSVATSHDLIKPLISSDDDEGAQRGLGGAASSKSSRTRISDLVHTIESQLLKRSARPPPLGAVNTLVNKSRHRMAAQGLEPAIPNAGDQRRDTASESGTKGGGVLLRGGPFRGEASSAHTDDEVSMDEVN